MKVRDLIGSIFVALAFSQCSDDELRNPNYPVEPSIAFKSIKFVDFPVANQLDILQFTILYKDGDSDLGLHHYETSKPYHYTNFFLEDGTGDTTKVTSELFTDHFVGQYFLIKSAGLNGKLVTHETRNKPNYGYLPELGTDDCINYSAGEILIHSNNIDDTYSITDTVFVNGQLHVVINEQPILFESNPYSKNIQVDFLMFENGVWTEFDWLSNHCVSFGARFPFIGNETGKIEEPPFKIVAKTPWDGSLTFSMASTGFVQVFGVKTLKLRITIYDRALHASNVIETPAFTLNGIK